MATKKFGNVLVHPSDTRFNVNHENDCVGLIYGQFYLLIDFEFEDVIRTFDVSTCVDDGEFAAVPIGFAVVTVTGHPTYRIDNSLSPLNESVKKSRLPNVRTSHNSNNSSHRKICRRKGSRNLLRAVILALISETTQLIFITAPILIHLHVKF